MKKYIASVDIGTTNIKINLFNDGYLVIDEVKYPHQHIQSDDNKFELDMEEVWSNLLIGLDQFINQYAINQLEIILTSAMHTIQLMDKDFSLSGSLITWADSRGADALYAMDESKKESQYYRTGTPGHIMNPYYKLLNIYQKDQLIGSVKDILFYKLTGEWVIDASNASSSGLFELEGAKWDRQSLVDIGANEENLPRVVAVDYSAPGKRALFDIEVNVIIGSSDGVSSNYIFNDLEDHAVLSVGTSHAVRVLHDQAKLNYTYQNFSYYIKDNNYLVGLPSNNGADILLWTNKIFNATFEELNQIIDQRPDTEVIFLPYINGERAPLWNDAATASLLNMSRSSSRESILFSIILGMIFNIKENVDHLRRLTYFNRIGLVGGVTQLTSFPQLLADVLGYPIYIPKMPNAETLGTIALVKNIQLPGEYLMIEPQNIGYYDDLFEQYKNQTDIL